MAYDESALEIPPSIERIIPFDKSWLIRLGVIDLMAGYDDTIDLLEDADDLSTDLQALLRTSVQWREGEDIDVGESGTLYRFLQFAAWHRGEDRTFVKSGTLSTRTINDDPTIVDLPLTELLKLDNGTSRWASAAVLLGNTEPRPVLTPYKLSLTYDAVEHWNQARTAGKHLEVRKDPTLAKQAISYIDWLSSGTMQFEAEQAEDYCFARAFDLIMPEEGEARWPSLRQHESDRISSMEVALDQEVVDSDDHRVVQAVAMRKGDSVGYANPGAVSKSWPRFWDLINLAS